MTAGPSAQVMTPGGSGGGVVGGAVEVVKSVVPCGRVVGTVEHVLTMAGPRTFRCCLGEHARWEVVRRRGA